MRFEGWSDAAILEEIGARVRQERLNRNLTAQSVADDAGLSLATVYKLEHGENHSMTTLIRILRVLGLLNRLDAFLPQPALSPVQLAALRGKSRQRASGTRRTKDRTASLWSIE